MYEELIQALREHADKMCVTFKRARACGSTLALEAADAIEELSHEIDIDNAAMTAMDAAIPRWIPVEERLPENIKNVLAAFDDVIVVAFYSNHEWMEVATCSVFFPTHWMPLPEPPEEET